MHAAGKVPAVSNGLGLAETAREAAELSSWELVLAANRGEAVKKLLTEDPEIIVPGFLQPQGETFRTHRQLKEDPETAEGRRTARGGGQLSLPATQPAGVGRGSQQSPRQERRGRHRPGPAFCRPRWVR